MFNAALLHENTYIYDACVFWAIPIHYFSSSQRNSSACPLVVNAVKASEGMKLWSAKSKPGMTVWKKCECS